MASGRLDSLPHSGAVITLFTAMGVTHRRAYEDFAVTVVIVALALALEH